MATDFEKTLDRLKHESCKKCGQPRPGYTVYRDRGYLALRCKNCGNLREFQVISPRKRKNLFGLTRSKARPDLPGGGPGLIESKRQRRYAKALRKARKHRYGWLEDVGPAGIAGTRERIPRGMSAIASDVALALQEQGFTKSEAKKAAQRARGSDFNSRFREALNLVKRTNPLYDRSVKMVRKKGKGPWINREPYWLLFQRGADGKKRRVGTAHSEHEVSEFLAASKRLNPRVRAALNAARKFFPPSRYRIRRNPPEPQVTAYGVYRSRHSQQEWYETKSRDARKRAKYLRTLGFKVSVSQGGPQVTPVGRINMTLLTVVYPEDREIPPPARVERWAR